MKLYIIVDIRLPAIAWPASPLRLCDAVILGGGSLLGADLYLLGTYKRNQCRHCGALQVQIGSHPPQSGKSIAGIAGKFAEKGGWESRVKCNPLISTFVLVRKSKPPRNPSSFPLPFFHFIPPTWNTMWGWEPICTCKEMHPTPCLSLQVQISSHAPWAPKAQAQEIAENRCPLSLEGGVGADLYL